MKVLAGDIGGTKTLLQVADVHDNDVAVVHRARFSSQDFADFELLLHAYLEQLPDDVLQDISHACFGVAGPVHGPQQGPRRASVTNLPWHLDETRLASHLRLPRVHLINDFFAAACGIEALRADDLLVLQHGTPQAKSPRLVVGAGTGLGVAQIVWCDGQYRAIASEGGHIHFAPTDGLQAELLTYMQRQFDRVSCERLVSGSGLAHIYGFLAHRTHLENELVGVMNDPDPAAAITRLAHEGDALASQAVSLFITLYGAVVGDLALVTLAYGGVYIAGGIAPKIADALRAGDFIASFSHKGRMSPLVQQMPVFIVVNQDVGLLGATLAPTRL